MGSRIHTNVGGLAARRQLLAATQRVMSTVRGLPGPRGAGGAAGLAHAERLRAEARAFARAAHATLAGAALAGTSKRALREVGAVLERMRQLAAGGAVGGSAARESELRGEERRLDGLARGARIGGRGLLEGQGTSLDVGLEPGASFELPALDARAAGLGVAGLSLATPAEVSAALARIGAALETVTRAQSALDAERATLEGHHAGLARAQVSRLPGERPPRDAAAALALATAASEALAQAPRAAEATHGRVAADVASSLLAE